MKRKFNIRSIKPYHRTPSFNSDQVRKDGTFIIYRIVSHRFSYRGGLILTVSGKSTGTLQDIYVGS